MQQIKSLINNFIGAWRSRFTAAGPVGKIGIGCGTLLILMCMCAVPLAIITPDSEPDLEPAASDR